MALSARENWFRAVQRTGPEWMPYEIQLTKASWHRFGSEQEAVVLRHPRSWPRYRQGDYHKVLASPWPALEDPTQEFIDDWGCAWRTTQYGYVGTVTASALADEAALAALALPVANSYNGGFWPVDFAAARQRLARNKADGVRARGSLDHGYFLLRLEYLRGFENLMCDLLDPSEEFLALYRGVHELNKAAVRHWIEAGAETIGLPEDLGGQDRSLIGPRLFRQWALPCYQELHRMAHDAGCLTYVHCDGNIMDIADQMLEIGPDVLNPQDRANGIDNLAAAFKGRICLDLDLDRQYTLPFGTPQEIEELIEYEVRTLGAPEGGLMMKVEIRGDVPPANLDAVASALERFCTYWHA